MAIDPPSLPTTSATPQGAFRTYLAAREANQRAFVDAKPEFIAAFETAIRANRTLGQILTSSFDRVGNTRVGLTHFFLIFERSVFAAMESLAARQAHQAWVSIRPGVEAVLIMGKWLADPANAAIWRERDKDVRAYQDAFSGAGLGRGSLPRGKDIQLALKMINDLYLHPNPQYSARHVATQRLDSGDVALSVDFFDGDDDWALGVLGILHLVVVMQHSMATTFSTIFPAVPPVDVGLASLEKGAEVWLKETMSRGAFYSEGLVKMGLWEAAHGQRFA